MPDLTKKLQEKKLKENLSDEEVAKAILKVMVKSKKWKDHAKMHQNAELVILATPGLDTHYEKKDKKNLPSLVLNLNPKSTEAEGKDTKKEEPEFVYGPQGKAVNFTYSAKGESPLFNYNGPGSNLFSYSKGENDQMVVAGCPCGFILQVAASNGKASEEHIKTHEGFSVSYSSLKPLGDIYGPQNLGSAGYGTNGSVNYGTPTTSGYNVKLQNEKKHATGF